jgi:hypothetical protein
MGSPRGVRFQALNVDAHRLFANPIEPYRILHIPCAICGPNADLTIFAKSPRFHLPAQMATLGISDVLSNLQDIE